jgi:hypothetical protein
MRFGVFIKQERFFTNPNYTWSVHQYRSNNGKGACPTMAMMPLQTTPLQHWQRGQHSGVPPSPIVKHGALL